MQIKNLLPVTLGTLASAQNFSQAIASQNASLSSLISLIASTDGLNDALESAKNITLLAPSNDAISAFLASPAGAAAAKDPSAVANLLTYHVLNGTFFAAHITDTPKFIGSFLLNNTFENVTSGQRVEAVKNGENIQFGSGLLEKSTVVTGNVNFTGGVIHIIDRVLTIPTSASSSAVALNLTSLAGALTSVNLVNTVDSLSDVTIFAPSNSALQNIGSALGTLTTDQLTGILTYHVVKGTVGYSSLLGNGTLSTVQGGSVTVRVEGGSVFVNSARVVQPDVLIAGGVVHVIDGVLNPNAADASPAPSGSPTSAVFSGASSVPDVPFTSGISAPASTTSDSAPAATGAGVASSSSSTAGAAMQTGVVGMGALLGIAGALLM